MLQLELFRDAEVAGSSTFLPNLRLPVHRWFRYSAGFSAEWVKSVVRGEFRGRAGKVLDPFAGSGTVLIACDECETESIGLEPHPLVYRIARAKLMWATSREEFKSLAESILAQAEVVSATRTNHPKLLTACFTSACLDDMDRLLASLLAHQQDTPAWQLCWLAFVSVIRTCSHAGTAQWQYVLPKKTKARVAVPFDAYRSQVRLFASDMADLQSRAPRSCGTILSADARTCAGVESDSVDLVVTSPPYANNYDYADATRLEMMVLREIDGWGDLQSRVRARLVRSCSQHVAAERLTYAQLLSAGQVDPIRGDLEAVCARLETEKQTHGGKKAYDAMVAAYFCDLAAVWWALRRVCRSGARVAMVIGDSAPYGVHVPVEAWLGQLALHAGFSSWSFEKWRDRNLKWKNRKHRVPLKEGVLWASA